MIEQRTFVTFEADFHDDSEFSSSGEISIPAGRGLGQALANALELQNFKVSEWVQYEFYAWQATAELAGRKCWILLQGGQPWLLIAEDRTGLLERIHKSKTSFLEVLMAIDAALKEHKIFSNISWFTRSEYENNSQILISSPQS